MVRFSGSLGFAILLASLSLGGRPAHAQSAPLTYWTPGWPMGLGGNSQNLDGYTNFPSFDGRGYATRYNFPNGMFVGTEAGALGFGTNGLSSSGAFGGLRYQGSQFGYNFRNSPITVFGGVDTLKYDSGIGAAFGPFDTTSSTAAGYTAHAGIEFRPTSNLSLSLGASFSQQQQSNLVDSDINSSLPPGASPLAFGHR